MRKRWIAAVAAAVLVVLALPSVAGAASTRTIRVTIKNTTPQVFSPPLFAVGRDADIFTVGEAASPGLVLIAEDGDASRLAGQLGRRRGVSEVVALETPVMPGRSVSVTLEVGPGEDLSIATMLVQTNDGFTGVSALPLDAVQGARIRLRSFDAGSEVNNELAEYVPGPPFGGHLRAPEDGVITYHPGILGVGDIDPATWDWEDPAALVTIRQL